MKTKKLSVHIVLFIFTFITCNIKAQGNIDPAKPNIVIILADDMGYGDVGYLGATDVRTPNVDALANEGIRFTQAYVSASVCGPSRAGLLTGVYQQRFDSGANDPELRWYNGEVDKMGLHVDQPMISELLVPYNYTSKVIGKWHMGMDEEYRPLQRGFNEFYGFLNGSHDYYEATMDFTSDIGKWPIFRNNNPVAFSGYTTDVFSDEAVTFIRDNADNPFFVYLSYNAVHHPWQVPQEYIDRLSHIENEDRRLFCAMLLAADDGVGRVVEELKNQGVYENTLIFFISDNGSPSGQSGNMSDTGGYRGWKGDTYEGGIRVPFVMNWPNKLTGDQTYHKPVSTLDVVPTIMSHLGQTSNNARFDFDGRDLVPYLNGTIGGDKPIHDTLFFRRDNDYAIRIGDWKLTWNDSDGTNRPLLFNMADDEFETTNLIKQYPQKAKELQNAFDNWDRELPDSRWWGGPSNRDYQNKLIENFDDSFEEYVFSAVGTNVTCAEVANPSPTGINTSGNVLQLNSASTNTSSIAAIKAKINSFTNHPSFAHVKLYSSAVTSVTFQIISGSNTHSFSALKNFSQVNEWQDVVFDCSSFKGKIDEIAVQVEYSTDLGDYDIYIDDIKFSIDPNPKVLTSVFTETTPFELEASDIENTQFTLSWFALKNATNYYILMDGNEIATASDTFLLVTNLDPESINHFSIIAKNTNGDMSLESNFLKVDMPLAPTVFDDFESGSTMFGDFAGGTTTLVENPQKSGINTSNYVLQIDLPADGTRKDWAGTVAANFSAINTSYRYLHVKVLKSVISPIYAKFTGSGNGTGSDILNLNEQTLTNEWEDIVFDMSDSEKSITALNIQVDRTGTRIAHTVYIDDIFMNDNPNSLNVNSFADMSPYGLKQSHQTESEVTFKWNALEGAVSYIVYVNDIEYTTTSSTETIISNLNPDEMFSLYIVAKNAANEFSQNSQDIRVYMPEYNYIMEDYEQATTTFINFAGSSATVVDNPLKEGLNVSNKVMKIDLPADATRKDWAGIVAPYGTLTPFSGNLRYIHLKVLKTVVSNVQCKPTGSGSGVGSDLSPEQAQVLTGEWEDLVFDIADGDKTITAINIQVDRTADRIAHTVYVDDIFINNRPEPYIYNIPNNTNNLKTSECRLYPNPVKDRFYLTHTDAIDSDIEVFNVLGQKLLDVSREDISNGIDISYFKSGVYIVKHSNKGYQFAQNILKL